MGKTSLLRAFTKSSFLPTEEATVGVDFVARNIRVGQVKVGSPEQFTVKMCRSPVLCPGEAAPVGHGGSGEVPLPMPVLLPQQCRRGGRLQRAGPPHLPPGGGLGGGGEEACRHRPALRHHCGMQTRLSGAWLQEAGPTPALHSLLLADHDD